MTEECLCFRPGPWSRTSPRHISSPPHAHRPESRKLEPAHVCQFDYDTLVIAPRPRLPPIIGATLQGVNDQRDLADVKCIRSNMAAGRKMVIFGASYIDLEDALVGCQPRDSIKDYLQAVPLRHPTTSSPDGCRQYSLPHRSACALIGPARG